jgi:dihydroflavonol-4-reductase
MDKNKIVLVTGAAGFTGKALALRLAKDGYRVRGTIRPGGNRDINDLTEAGIEVVESDIASREDCARAVAGCGAVFNIAAMFRRANAPDSDYDRINRQGVINLIDAASEANANKIVHCSTIGVCGHIETPPADENTPYNPGDIYQRTKMEGEKAALAAFREGRIRGTVVRPASIYGPGDLRLLKLFRMIAKRRMIIFGSGKPTFHTVYIDDLVEGFIRAMDTPEADGEVFIVAGAEYVPLNTLFDKIADILQVPPPRLHIPAWPVQLLGTIVENICIPVGINPPIYRRRVDFFTKSRAFDISKSKRILGYQPAISLDEGLKRTAEWYKRENLL